MDANAWKAAGGMVCLCKQWELAAALRCALKLSMSCCPFGPVSNAEPSLCYTVEHVDTNCLDEDEDEDEDVGVKSLSPNTSMAVDNFGALCETYFNTCRAIMKTEPYDIFAKNVNTMTVNEEWASCAGANAENLLKWWHGLS